MPRARKSPPSPRKASGTSPSEEFFRLLLEDLETGLAGFDARGRLAAANGAFFFRLAMSGLLGKVSPAQARDMLEKGDVRKDFPLLVDPPRKVTGGNGQSYRILGASHEEGPLSLSLQIQRPFTLEEEGSAAGLFPAGTAPIGGELLRDFAHETRTLLTNIQGFSEMMLSEQRVLSQAPAFAEWAMFIRESASTMLAEMQEMLELLQLVQGDAQLDARRVSLPGLIREVFVVNPGKCAASWKGLALDLPEGDAPFVRGEKSLLRKAVRLICASMGRSAPGARLRIAISEEEETALVRFVQKPSGESPPEEERGKGHPLIRPLGIFALPLARAIVMRHEGVLDYHEEAGGAAVHEMRLATLK